MDCRTGVTIVSTVTGMAKKAVLRICMIAVLASAAASAAFGTSIAFPDFSAPGGQIVINDSAAFVLDSLSRPVLRLAPQGISKAGSAWYFELVPVASGFSTTFTFRMSANGADGLAFVIQHDPAGTSALSGSGGTIGYGGGGLHHAVALEFDTYFNPDETKDPFGNHVAINESAGQNPIYAIHLNNLVQDPGVTLNDGYDHVASISYSPGWLSVGLDGRSLFGGPVAMDLSAILGSPNAYVGFTAATGAGWQDHDLVNWDFEAVPEPASVALLGTGLAVLVLFASRRRK